LLFKEENMKKRVFIFVVAVLMTFPAVTALWGQAPKTAQEFVTRAAIFFERGDFTTAIADFSEAIRLNPNYWEAYYARGLLYVNFGDYDRAIADLTQVIRLNLNNADAYCSRGSNYMMKKDWNNAIADFEAALRINSNHTQAKEGIRLVRQARGW
jgi:tetratricopeptide (TPR) repeat protein